MKEVRRTKGTWLRAVILFSVLALIAAACGGETAETTTTAAETTTTAASGETTTAPAETTTTEAMIDEDVPDPLQIGVGGMGSLAYTAAYVAAGGGFLDEELAAVGTTAELIGLEGSVAGVQAVVAGDVPYVASVTSTMLNSIAQGAEVQQIVQFLNTDLVFFTANPGEPTDISDPASMVEGKRWGIPQFGSSGYVTALKTLATWGYTEDDIEFVETGNVASAVGAVEQQVADYYWIGTAGLPLIDDGTLELVLNFYDPQVVEDIYGGPYATSGLMATPEWLEAHPETTKAIVRAFARALEFIADNVDNPQAIADAFPPDLVNDNTVPTLEWVAAGHSPDGEVLTEAIERVIQSAKDGGLIEQDQEFDVDTIVNNDYR